VGRFGSVYELLEVIIADSACLSAKYLPAEWALFWLRGAVFGCLMLPVCVDWPASKRASERARGQASHTDWALFVGPTRRELIWLHLLGRKCAKGRPFIRQLVCCFCSRAKFATKIPTQKAASLSL